MISVLDHLDTPLYSQFLCLYAAKELMHNYVVEFLIRHV